MIDRLAAYWASKKQMSSKIWRWLSILLTIAMIVYLTYAFTRGKLRLDQFNWKTYGWTILVVLWIYLFLLIIQFFIWSRIISFHRKADIQDVAIYSRTILMRSLPGGAWHWVGRISMYSDETQVPTRVVVVGNFLEWVLVILSGIGIFFMTLPSQALGFSMAALVFGASIVLGMTWRLAARNWIARVAEGGLWVALDGLAWLLNGVIFFLIVQAVAGRGQLSGVEALRAWSFTGSLGVLVSMFPSSLGVREISLVWLLQAKLSSSIVLLIALMLRLIYMLGDVIWGVIGWLISSLILRNRNKTN